jgi:hypothetical protein
MTGPVEKVGEADKTTLIENLRVDGSNATRNPAPRSIDSSMQALEKSQQPITLPKSLTATPQVRFHILNQFSRRLFLNQFWFLKNSIQAPAVFAPFRISHGSCQNITPLFLTKT